jgi:hypothetical protein
MHAYTSSAIFILLQSKCFKAILRAYSITLIRNLKVGVWVAQPGIHLDSLQKQSVMRVEKL